MAGKHARQFQNHTSLCASVIAARRVRCGVKNVGGSRIVVATDNHKAIGGIAGQPRDHVVRWRVRTIWMRELIQADLQSWNRAVLTEEVVACGRDPFPRCWLVRTGLAGSEVLECLGGVED